MGEICITCGLPKEICACEHIAREQQEIRIFTTKRRYGKIVTIVEGIDGTAIDLEDFAKTLKTRCAAGGTVKKGNIELQGDHSKRVSAELKKLGFSVEER